MISLMTLDATQAGLSADSQRARIEPLRQDAIDLLCCQAMTHSRDGRVHLGRLLSSTLGLTCSCFAAGRHQPGPWPDGSAAAKGLATFTASGVWVLNSGSFTVGEDDEEELVQFALIRKHGVSVLVLNLHLAASTQTQVRQLRDLLVHPLLREPYGAVALCADREARLSGKQWQGIGARSLYSPHRTPPATNGGGLLCLLTTKNAPVSLVAVRQPDPAFPGLAMTFEIHRAVSDKPSRLAFPLSFREQWLGYKEHRAFA